VSPTPRSLAPPPGMLHTWSRPSAAPSLNRLCIFPEPSVSSPSCLRRLRPSQVSSRGLVVVFS
jgi:hypothetical protein